jgi:glutamyl-tRNA reductase
MPFLALGVEHKTAPLSVRESVVMDVDAVSQASAHLARAPEIAELAILSTCNRTEIYLFADEPAVAGTVVAEYLVALDSRLQPYLRRWDEMDAVEHLFRVTSGLESQVLGEPQILSQVRETLQTAERLGTIGPNLHSLFRASISCARQARTGTRLGRISVSIGSEAVAAAKQELVSLEGRRALLIGGGEIIRLVAVDLRGANIGPVFIANRTDSVAVELAELHGGTPVPLADIGKVLPSVDVVISATSAPHYVLTPEDLPTVELERRETPLLIFDLAIPRDVDPEVASFTGIVLHDLDGLLPSGLDDHWDDDVRAMEAVIAAEVQEFTAWYLTRRVAPVIASLRSHVEAVSEGELRRVAPQLAGLTDREHAAVESMSRRLIDKMFHHLVMRLRLAAQTDPKLVDAAEFFFLHGEGGLFEHAAQTAKDQSDTPSSQITNPH